MERSVLVGVDGSESALQAVRWAAGEAVRRGAPLLVEYAWVWPLYRVSLGPAPGAPAGAGLQAQAERVLADAVDAARRVAPELDVDSRLVTGDTAARLVEGSKNAQLLVVGSRGLGGFAGLLLGSVGVACAMHAACPVVVVRGEAGRSGPVVLGIDGHDRSHHAVSEAFALAQRLGAPVRAVHSFTVPLRQEGASSYRDHLVAAEEDARALVEKELAAARVDYPDVEVEVVLGDHPPAKELLLHSETAGIVVVGARGSGGFAGLLLGSTSQALVHHSHCPVMVVR
ncbi:MAG TPA: universal stress protein [Actinomycetes bacterium]|nr:universal stress protein [Actinomycetes bacterium]